MTPLNVLSFIQDKFQISLTRGWLNQFFLRHRDSIKKARSFPQEDSRMSVPRANLKEHIANMHKYIDGRYSELVFNLDEVGTSEWEDRKPKKVFIDKSMDSDSITHSIFRRITHITILTCVSAAGDSLMPLLIMKYSIQDSLWKTGLRQDEDAMIRTRDPPYIDRNLFKEYIKKVIISYINYVRQTKEFESKEALIMMDSCSVHCDMGILKLFGKNNIIVFTFPSHTTNIFQALDLVLYGIFKKIKNENEDNDGENKLEKIIIKILNAHEKVATSFNIRSAFRRAGLVPIPGTEPKKLEFVAENVVKNPGFRQIWELNIKAEELPKRMQNQKFGIMNEEFLPGGCRVIINSAGKYEDEREIEKLFQ